MLVPAMQSIGTCSSSSTFSTPTCAPPFAPPPASTRPTRGRLAALVSSAQQDPAGFSSSTSALPHRTALRRRRKDCIGSHLDRQRSTRGRLEREQGVHHAPALGLLSRPRCPTIVRASPSLYRDERALQRTTVDAGRIHAPAARSGSVSPSQCSARLARSIERSRRGV